MKNIIWVLSIVACLGLAACGEDESAESSAEAEATAETAEAPEAEEPAAEEPAEEPAADPCARVTTCCETMGQQWGGGSQRDCQSTATGGDAQACTDYLTRMGEINAEDGHALNGRVFPECMPAE